VARGLNAKDAAKEIAALVKGRGLRRTSGEFLMSHGEITDQTVYGWWKKHRSTNNCGQCVATIAECELGFPIEAIKTGRRPPAVSVRTALKATKTVLDSFLGDDLPAPKDLRGL
jgi:hypothetical protein